MIYDFMKILVFFDLPTVSNIDIDNYKNFRKFLLSDGYHMLQFSLYVKTCNNRDAAVADIQLLKKMAPQKGHIRVMLVTEKQYARMLIIVGGKSYQEEKVTIDPFVDL